MMVYHQMMTLFLLRLNIGFVCRQQEALLVLMTLMDPKVTLTQKTLSRHVATIQQLWVPLSRLVTTMSRRIEMILLWLWLPLLSHHVEMILCLWLPLLLSHHV
jgi:hypothetical protein